MLFMVIEHFKQDKGGAAAVGERFRRCGRMLPVGEKADGDCGDGVIAYIASWMEANGSRCFQLMESPDRAALDPWLANWIDLVDVEVVPVLTSTAYWAPAQPAPP